MVYRYVTQLSFQNGGGPGVNVWHFRGDGTTADIQRAVDSIGTFYTSLKNILQPGMTVTGPGEVTNGIEGTSPTIENVTGWTVTAGTTATSSLSPALQIVAGWRTTAAVRSGRGRTFVGPLGNNAAEGNGTPTTQALDLVRTGCQAILDHNDGFASAAIGIWSDSDSVIRDITAFKVRDVFAVLRSRRD